MKQKAAMEGDWGGVQKKRFPRGRGRVSGCWVGLVIGVAFALAALIHGCSSSSKQADPSNNQQSPASSALESRSAVTRPNVGFASRQKLVEHYQKHGREFGSVTLEAYLRQAQELRDRPAGGNVLESVRADGVISRFDRTSGAFIAFNPDGMIRTYFRPNDGEAYFRRQARRSN